MNAGGGGGEGECWQGVVSVICGGKVHVFHLGRQGR